MLDNPKRKVEISFKETIDIVNRSPVVIFLWDNAEGWPVKFVSENVVHLFGYAAEEFMSGKPPYAAVVHADDLERITDEVARKSKEKSVRTFRHEPYRIITKTGNEKYVSDLTTIRRNRHGVVTHYEGILYDVSELVQKKKQIKRALEEKETLLREIHHRVKNNMQIIISLLKLQSGKIEDREHAGMFEDTENRIRSMALIHELLYQTEDFARIEFYGYVRRLVNNLFRSHGVNQARIKLKMAIEDISLGMDNAIPCGLLINEVISNSLKYAFPDHREGEIRIGLYPAGDNSFELTVSDDGVGIPEAIDFDTADTMGLMLVRILAVDQLDGTIDLNRDGGTAFRVRFGR